MIHSGEFSGMDNELGKVLLQMLEAENHGKRRINYRLRDWLVSRQRYWGAPIPTFYCPQCGRGTCSEKKNYLSCFQKM